MKKALSLLLSFTLFVSLLTPFSVAYAEKNNQSSTVKITDAKTEDAISPTEEKELVDERTLNSKVFLEPSGAKRVEISTDPIHYFNESTNQWEEINPILIQSGKSYSNKANLFSTNFSNTISDVSSIFSITNENHSIELQQVEWNGEIGNSAQSDVSDNQISYKNIFDNTDLIYTVGNGKIKEDIILYQKPTSDEITYTFQLNIEGLTAEQSDDGIIYLIDEKTGEKQFEFEKPYMVDSSKQEGFVSRLDNAMPEGTWSDQIDMDIEQEGSILFVTVTPNSEWLQSSERVFPVTIDPTIKIYQPKNNLNDTNIRSALPTTTGGADLELGAGYHSLSNNIIRSLLQFDLGVLPAGSTILSSQLNLRLSSAWNDTSTQIGLYEVNRKWVENQASWTYAQTQPSTAWSTKGGDYYQTRLSTQTIGALDTTASEPQLFKWDISADVVQKWVNSSTNNFGLLLKAENETLATYKKFYSGDYSAYLQYSPTLSITYYPTSRLGLENYWSYTEHSVGNGTGYLNLGTGNNILQFTDFEVTGRGNSGFSFTRTYNSKGTDDTVAGFRWSYSGSETVFELPNKNVIYTDTDGTAHIFTYNASTNTYSAPAGVYLTLSKAAYNAYQIKDTNGNRMVFRELNNDSEVNGRIFYIEYEEDRNTNRINYKRQSDGALTQIQDATGRILEIFLDNNGRIESISFENTKKASYTYDDQGNLKTVMEYTGNNTGSLTQFTYNKDGLLETVTDGNNQTTTYNYTNGFLTSISQPHDENNVDTHYSFDIANYKMVLTDAEENETVYRMDENYVVTAITDPLGYTSSLQFDENYNVIKEIDGEGNSTSYTYDEKGNVLTSTDGEKNVTTYTYNAYSQPLTITDAKGTTVNEYNTYGDLISTTNAEDEKTEYGYDEYGNLTSTTLPDGTVEEYGYDDDKNYQTTTTDPLGRITKSVKDKYGNTTSITTPLLRTTHYLYNLQNQLEKVTDAKNQVTSYGYDKNGNLTSITNALGNTIKMTYTDGNQLKTQTEPMGETTNIEYDSNGNQSVVQNPSGDSIQYSYDNNNQLTNVSINNYKKWTYTYDGNGNVETVTNDVTNDVKVFEYDNNDNVTKETISGRIIQYGYDNTNELASIAVQSNGKTFSQLYQTDSVGRLTHLKRGGASQVSMVYTKTGLVEQLRYVNGVHSNYEYDNAQQLQDMNVTKGTTILLEESFAYDSDSNLTNVTSSMGDKSYKYDEINQLVSQTLPNNVTETYEYDAVGNRTKKTVTANGESTVFEYGYNANNQLVNANGHSYTYDENGNRTSDDKYEYVYNKFDQLTEIKTLAGKSVATYAYDEEGRRISKTVDGVTTNYHYDQGINVLFETDSQGNITKEYSYDQSGFPLTMTYNNKIYYYILNGQKDVIGLTDSTGAFVAQYEYDAWGNILSQSGDLASINPLRCKGYHYDEESQLYYLQARYYDSVNGVFLALDPVLGDITDPGTMNGYNYANNNPVMNIDPNGQNKARWNFAFKYGFKKFLAQWVGWSLAEKIANNLYSFALGSIGFSKLVKAEKKSLRSLAYTITKASGTKGLIKSAKREMVKYLGKRALRMFAGGVIGVAIGETISFGVYVFEGYMKYKK